MAYLLGYNKASHPIHGEWIRKAIWSEKESVWQAHRGSYKTTCIVVAGSIGRGLFEPNEEILILRKTVSKAKETFREIMLQWERNEELQTLYEYLWGSHPVSAEWSVMSGINLSAKTRISKHHTYEYAGIDTPITGAHYSRIYSDDVVTLADRMYPSQREKTALFMQEIRSNILNPDGTIIHSGTPWHPEDYFHDLENQGIQFHRYPISESFVDEFTEEKQEQLRAQMSPSMYAANYELKHIADKDRWFGHWQTGEPERPLSLTMYVDPNFGGGDYSAAVIGAYDARAKLFYVVGADAWRGAIEQNVDRYFELYRLTKANKLVIEDNSGGAAIIAMLKNKGLRNVSGKTNTRNKFERIESELLPHWRDIRFNPNDSAIGPEFMRQITDYEQPEDYKRKPGIKYDAPDALAGLVELIRPDKAQGFKNIPWL